MATNNIKIQVNNFNKKFNCSYCNKALSSRQSKWRHENTCTSVTNTTNTLETRITQLEKLIIPSIDTSNKLLDLLITNVISTYSIIKNNYFNKTIISNENNFKFIINNSIDVYIGLANELPSKNNTIKFNLKYLNKIKILPVKHQNYQKYIDKLISTQSTLSTLSTLSTQNNESDNNYNYESDSSDGSIYSDISDF